MTNLEEQAEREIREELRNVFDMIRLTKDYDNVAGVLDVLIFERLKVLTLTKEVEELKKAMFHAEDVEKIVADRTAALKSEKEKLREAVASSQKILAAYVVPNGITHRDCIQQLLGVLDDRSIVEITQSQLSGKEQK